MFMTCIKRHVIRPKMNANSVCVCGGGGQNREGGLKYLHLKMGLIGVGVLFERGSYLGGGGGGLNRENTVVRWRPPIW